MKAVINYYNYSACKKCAIQFPILTNYSGNKCRDFIRKLLAEPFFLMVGTIEPRKNHIFILKIWEKLLSESSQLVPKLVIVERGWKNKSTFRLLDRLKASFEEIVEINDACDSEVGYLLKNTKSLLMPSFVEGFNMVLNDSIELGASAIVSKIDAHEELVERNVGQKNIQTLSLDSGIWLNHIKQKF